MVTTPPQQFCVRWNSYQSNLQNAFPKLLTSEHFVDVTLACENEMLKCHKVVLSACSTYFEKLLLNNPCQHPIIFMKDMKFSEMQSLVDFMYKGEVNVTQDDLPSLLKSAEALQIRGLCGSDQLLNPTYFSNITKAATSQYPGNPPTPTTTQVGSPDDPLELSKLQPSQVPMNKNCDLLSVKKEPNQLIEGSDSGNNHSSSECDSNDGMLQIKEDGEDDGESFFEGETELMDQELTEEEGTINTDIKPQFSAIANVSCQYDSSPEPAVVEPIRRVGRPLGSRRRAAAKVRRRARCRQTSFSSGSANRRIRRSDEELRRAAECITRGQTFQTVSDQFNIPISTIRFYMARKGILPRRKRGRACAGPMGMGMGMSGMPISTSYTSPSSPIGPPYHIVHYKLPALGVSKLK